MGNDTLPRGKERVRPEEEKESATGTNRSIGHDKETPAREHRQHRQCVPLLVSVVAMVCVESTRTPSLPRSHLDASLLYSSSARATPLLRNSSPALARHGVEQESKSTSQANSSNHAETGSGPIT